MALSTPTCTAAVSGSGLAINVSYTTPIGSTPPLFVEVWRVDTVLGITLRLATQLVVSSVGLTLADYHAASGVGYQYFVRVYATDGSSADSVKTGTVTLSLHRACLSDTLNPTASNCSLYNTSMTDASDYIPLTPIVSVSGGGTGQIGSQSPSWLTELKDATAPQAFLGSVRHQTFTVSGLIPPSEEATQRANLKAIFALQDTLCYRDATGVKLFCVMPRLPFKYYNQTVRGTEFALDLYEVYYSESDQRWSAS